MKFSNNGLTLWYGGPDTPAPPDEDARRNGESLVVAVRPPRFSNSVVVRYRVDGGPISTIDAYEWKTDFARSIQYFRANFPRMPKGHRVDYGPLLKEGGRQISAPGPDNVLPSSFLLSPTMPGSGPPSVANTHPPSEKDMSPRFAPNLEFIGSVRGRFSQQAEVIGDTPAGLRINYYLAGGQITGPRLLGKILPGGADFLTIRPDGVGAVQVRATFETHDGALLSADYYGCVDLGENGYNEARQGRFPKLVSLQLAPRFLTGDKKYLWMNRHQFLGVGQVRVADGTVDYDLFLVHNDTIDR